MVEAEAKNKNKENPMPFSAFHGPNWRMRKYGYSENSLYLDMYTYTWKAIHLLCVSIVGKRQWAVNGRKKIPVSTRRLNNGRLELKLETGHGPFCW